MCVVKRRASCQSLALDQIKVKNTKEQNFSQDQTETNLIKSSVLLKYLKEAMIINKTWLWNRMSGSLLNKYFKDLIQIISVVRKVCLLPIP